MLARGWPRLGPEDTEISVGITCLGLTGRLLGEVLARIARGDRLPGEPQRTAGRLLRGAAWRLRRDLEQLARRHLLRQRSPSSPERVELYLEDRPRAAAAAAPAWPRSLRLAGLG